MNTHAFEGTIDRAEDRYRKVSPLVLYFLFLRRFWGSLALLAVAIGLPAQIAMFAVSLSSQGDPAGATSRMQLTPLAILFAVVLGAVLFDLVTRNPGRIFGLFGAALTILLAIASLPALLLGLGSAGRMIEAIASSQPFLAFALFLPVPIGVFYFFHVIWVLGRASLNLLLASKLDLALMREVRSESTVLGRYFLRILALPPLFRICPAPATTILRHPRAIRPRRRFSIDLQPVLGRHPHPLTATLR